MSDATQTPQDVPPTLYSSFALEQFRSSARRLDAQLFTHLWRPVFNVDIAPAHFVALHQALNADTLANVVHEVVDSTAPAVLYNAERKVIEVSKTEIERALAEPERTPALLLNLLTGFAHYVGGVLDDYQRQGQAGDAPSSPVQSACETTFQTFASTLLFYNTPVASGSEFATYEQAGSTQTLTLTLSGEAAPQASAFSAGQGNQKSPTSFGHESIEAVLREVGFDEAQCKAIYFGNWLRDYSQLIDAKLVLPAGEADATSSEMLQAILDGSALRISRKKLTAIVHLFALKEFNSLQLTEQGREDYRVTPKRLGVYLPHEHVDNPTTLDVNASDPQLIDPDFAPLVLPDSPRNNVMPKRSMKRYLRRPAAYMKRKLDAAQKAGMTPTGLRYLGEALHVLEDYFAHSNYVELMLRKVGHDAVLVWTTRIETREQSRHEWPVVTGLFGALDIVGSVVDPLATLLYPCGSLEPQNLAPGERSDFDKAMLILLEDERQPLLKNSYELYLNARDGVRQNWFYQTFNNTLAIIELPKKTIDYATGLIKRPLLKWAGDHIGTLQAHLDKDPNVDAAALVTHSQLSKDHDTHPFHTLAVELASEAVRTVGKAMFEQWNGTAEEGDSPSALAERFLVHPNDSERFDELARQWAEANPQKVEQGTSLETLRTLQTEELDQALEDIKGAWQSAEAQVQEIEELTNTSFWSFANAPSGEPF
ncbi:HET-C-related protein [Pseudomonas sp.]|uniref:HET-C-related protein n=1 Tax=Pseudomonas sp. TaxID=306 RepID=UPI0028AFE050|nr:HET-C-related protein [Pseudomonas sp.]